MGTVPNHIAFIPDGNRRWAKAQRLNPWEGHNEGTKRFWDNAESCFDAGVNYATYWAGSYDNLQKRSKIEVSFLLGLLDKEILNPKLRGRFVKNKVRFRVVGEWKDFVTNKSTLQSVEQLESDTAHFENRTLTILFGYDGQREMLAAMNNLKETSEVINDETLRDKLWTGDLPDVDLVVRTGGEPHWSAGFMMWLTANSQYSFTNVLWPDFTEIELKKALADYDSRERRMGQ